MRPFSPALLQPCRAIRLRLPAGRKMAVSMPTIETALYVVRRPRFYGERSTLEQSVARCRTDGIRHTVWAPTATSRPKGRYMTAMLPAPLSALQLGGVIRPLRPRPLSLDTRRRRGPLSRPSLARRRHSVKTELVLDRRKIARPTRFGRLMVRRTIGARPVPRPLYR